MFIMVDGIDGSGKSTVVETWKEHLIAEGNPVFDLKKYWRETGTSPSLSELKNYDFIISGEPTYVGVGAVIRQELIRQGTSYSARSIAEAYALDRLVLYHTLLIPLLQEGKIIIQDRGVSTSFAYQPVTDPAITPSYLESLEGNRVALEHRPDYLVLINTPASVAMERLQSRTDKQDNVIFEQRALQEKLANRFGSSDYQNFFSCHGTVIKELPGHTNIDILQADSIALLTSLLKF